MHPVVFQGKFVSHRPLFKSRGLISGERVCCDLTLMGQIVPVKSDCLCVQRWGGGSYRERWSGVFLHP